MVYLVTFSGNEQTKQSFNLMCVFVSYLAHICNAYIGQKIKIGMMSTSAYMHVYCILMVDF